MPSVVEALRDVLARDARRTRAVDRVLVSGRDTDGTVLGETWDEGQCVARGCVTGAAAGELVPHLARSCHEIQGTAGVAGIRATGAATFLWVTSLDPDSYPRAASYSVTVTGLGFTPATQFQFLLPHSEEIHPGITIDSKAYVSSTTYTLEITVAADAELVEDLQGSLAADNGGAL